MKSKALKITLTLLLASGAGTALACEYIKGESKYTDYANCRYGEDSVLVIELPDSSAWEQCIYHIQAFRPEKLLAVTKQQNGKEVLSINDRSQIGNPCYMTKRSCDAALQVYKQGTN